MKRITPENFPRMRKQGLVVDDLPDEVLVYDLASNRAHCLNHTAALVWRACDGHTAAPEIARRLTAELDAHFDEKLVWLALAQLEKLGLLDQSAVAPARFTQLSRRQLIRSLGLAAVVAVPVVTSIVAPTAVQAATCRPSNSPCSPTIACCSVWGCNPSGKCN
ncbi:MAG: hypothetical protein QOD33_230 [Pyrinomonadaceae bacterium]|nr:hypothetical protein [Pyrinomonadaceae bacterium]